MTAEPAEVCNSKGINYLAERQNTENISRVLIYIC